MGELSQGSEEALGVLVVSEPPLERRPKVRRIRARDGVLRGARAEHRPEHVIMKGEREACREEGLRDHALHEREACGGGSRLERAVLEQTPLTKRPRVSALDGTDLGANQI